MTSVIRSNSRSIRINPQFFPHLIFVTTQDHDVEFEDHLANHKRIDPEAKREKEEELQKAQEEADLVVENIKK